MSDRCSHSLVASPDECSMCLGARYGVEVTRERVGPDVRGERLVGLGGLSAGGFVSSADHARRKPRTAPIKKPRNKSERIKAFELARETHRTKVVELREQGLPWNQIASAIGVSRPAVQKWSRLWGLR